MIDRGDRQPLNAVDASMRCADVALRQLGYPGIETQMLVWLEGRADRPLLQAAIARLSRSHPVIAARLVEPPGEEYSAYWQYRPGAVCPLRERTVASESPSAVLETAAEILSNGQDPALADPLEFHLLHRPGGRDVLVLQYNHALMDNTASVPLLRHLERLCQGESPPREPPRRIFAHLRQTPKATRRQAVRAAIDLQAHALRGRAATLVSGSPDRAEGRARLRIASRTLRAPETTRLRTDTIARCGFPCLSMAILGSAFRAVAHFGPRDEASREFIAGIGLPLSHTKRQPLLFQNWTSAVPIHVPRAELDDRSQLVRLLSDQLRQQLQAGVELGVLETTAIFRRRFRFVEWVIWHLIRYGYSLWYGYFGELDTAGRQLAGAPIDDLFYAGGPVWSAIGLTLLVSQYQGRTHLQATYDPQLVSSARAEAFLEFVVRDLMPAE